VLQVIRVAELAQFLKLAASLLRVGSRKSRRRDLHMVALEKVPISYDRF